MSALPRGPGGPADVGALADFFGKLSPDRSKLLADDVFARDTFNLPRAYEGKNIFLENVLDYLITKESDWYTSAALPWMATDQLSVAWEIFRFNKTLMDLEPEQAAPRYVTAERERRSDALQRRGLGFIIEHGFYTTDEGRQHYLMSLRQISDSVHETAYFGVMRAILTCHDFYKAWRSENGPIRRNFGDIIKTDLARFGCIQKDELGLYMLDAQIKHDFRRHGREHDLIVVPDTMSMYVTMVPQYGREYNRSGPGAMERLTQGEDGFLTFRGSRVVETRPFDIDFMGQGVDLLVQDVQIGDWYGRKRDGSQLQASDSIHIYSADSDRFEKVKASDATHHVAKVDGKWTLVEGQPSGEVILIRPFRRYSMGSVVFMKGGMQTGFTAHGHHDFQLSDDVVRKVHVGHYTFYHKSIVKDEKNICIAENVFGRDYHGGEGHGFMNDDDLANAKLGEWDQVSGSILAVKVKGNLPESILSLTGDYKTAAADLAARYEAPSNSNEGFPILKDLGFNVNNDTTGTFLTDMARINTLCHQGMQLDDEGEVVFLNKGPWGPNVYEGCIKARSGEMAFLRDCGYEQSAVKVGGNRATRVRPVGGQASVSAAPAPSSLGTSSARRPRGKQPQV